MSGEPRIGVLLCMCRPEMRERLDLDSISSLISAQESVVHVEKHPLWCLRPGLARLKEIFREHELDRLIVAGCSYRTHRRIFEQALEEAGLNRYLLEIVNLRDQCAAVHPEGATERAIDQIMMGIARAVELQPLEEITAPTEKRALVLGGGLCGLIAADTLAAADCEVIVVEQGETLGGYLSKRRPWMVHRGDTDVVSDLKARLSANPSVEVLLSSRLSKVDREPGGFDVEIETPEGDKYERVGAIVLATGSAAAPTGGAYGHDGRKVRTQEEFEELLYDREPKEAPVSIVMIQCVGSRNEKRPYCSRVCCADAVRNATEARQKWPDSRVAILFRDLEMGCLTERAVKRARAAGVEFYRFDEASPPVVEDGRVTLADTMTGKEIAFLYDLIVLSVGQVPNQKTRETVERLGIKADAFGFIPEPTMRLKPLDYTGRGIYVVGSAHWPASPEESMYQAFEMASRAAAFLEAGRVVARPIVASVDETLCIGCHLCMSMCAWGAIQVSETSEGNKARVQATLCKGCGTCVASCPSFAIRAAYYSDEQIRPAIKAAVMI